MCSWKAWLNEAVVAILIWGCWWWWVLIRQWLCWLRHRDMKDSEWWCTVVLGGRCRER
ncbi:hypothetical protein Hanom_Chr05g00416581 [Helianthus anomalus]